jgi:hypothetical protein
LVIEHAEKKADRYRTTRIDRGSPDEEALREEYRRRLAEMLKDPEFRKIEGFPIGDDEAILALSDPPYYTACPNPFLNEIVEKWRSERAALRDELGLPSDEPAGSKYIIRENMPTKNYHREPFAQMFPKARTTRSITRIHITPRSRIKPLCGISCITRTLAMWYWMASVAPA